MRKINRLAILLSMGAGIVLFSLSSCDIDHGLKPPETRISGYVIFDGPPPPPSVAEVRVVAAKRFPPVNLTSDVIFSNQLKFNRDPSRTRPDTVAFEIITAPGSYPATGALWREGGQAWELTNVLGIYTDPLQLAPKVITIDEQNPVFDDVVIESNWQLANRNAFIEGEITFRGEWPQNTELLALAVFPIVPNPQNPLQFLTLQALDIAIPTFSSTPFRYRTRVPAGTHRFIAVFWKGRGSGLLDIRAIGFHRCAGDTLVPRAVVVADSTTASGSDIIVDLSSLPRGVDYALTGALCDK